MNTKQQPALITEFIDKALAGTSFANKDDEDLARVITGIIGIAVVSGIVLAVLINLSSGIAGFNIIQIILLINSGLLSLVFLFLRFNGNIKFCSQLVVVIAFVASEALVYSSGGPMGTPANPLLVMTPLLAFTLLGKRSGIIWAGVVIACQGLFAIAMNMGHGFPNAIPSSINSQSTIIIWMLSVLYIISCLMVLEAQVSRLRRERDIEHEQQEFFSSHDALTSLINRPLYEMRLQRALARSRRSQQRVALILVNIDKFKIINEQLGVDAGDIALKTIAARIADAVRQTDTVARTSGDEFGIILEDFSSVTDARRIATTVQQKLARPIVELGGSVTVTASIGLSLAPDHGLDPNMLQHFADAAMTQAKQKRNCICQYDPGISN